MAKRFKVEKQRELRIELPQVDEPRDYQWRRQNGQSKDLYDSARQLLETFGHAKLGRTVFSDYAIEYRLKDTQIALYYIFMVIGFLIDIALVIFIVGLISTLLIAFIYVTLRGVNAWDETVHIIRTILQYVHRPLP